MKDERQEKREDEGELHKPVVRPSSVVSIRFDATDIRAVREAATRFEVTTSEFIRTAAVERAREVFPVVTFRVTGAQGFRPIQTESISNAPQVVLAN